MKYYSVQADVDLDAIRHNIIEMKGLIRPSVKLMAVIKADGYGHGAVAVAKALEEEADYFAVAHVSEAVELRRYGIEKPILILGYCCPEEFELLLEHNITINVICLEDALRLSEFAARRKQTARIHIKIDTGMNRIGFTCDSQTVESIKEIARLPYLELEGIFTHFAKADEKDKTAFEQQKMKFHQLLQELEQEGIQIPLRHAANSAAIIEEGDLGLDMVRPGISTYGLYPSTEVDQTKINLIPAMSLRSRITYVKTVPAETGIGYGWTYVTEKETRIATVPVGYGDGYKRALSNQSRVLIHGVSAPVIGRICMDQLMVDVTQIPEVQIGDWVTLFGRDGEEQISIEELADASSSFNYEFLCGITRRVPRVYTWNGKVAGVLDYMEQEPYIWEME